MTVPADVANAPAAPGLQVPALLPRPSARRSDEPRLLDRALRPFANVRAGEAARALGLLLSLFLLMVAYYVLKTVREPLVLVSGGAELKSYAAGLQALALIGFVPAYAWLTARVRRRGLVLGLVGFYWIALQLFFVAVRLHAPYVGVAFFVWVGIFSLSTIAQLWSVANDLYRPADGERLFPLIAFGATIGSPVGARLAQALFAHGVGVPAMLQIAAALLVAHGALTWWLAGGRAGDRDAAVDQPLGGRGGIALVARSPYLRLVALLLVLLNLVNTVGEYILSKHAVAAVAAAVTAGQAASASAFLGSFYGGFFFWVNVTSALVQALVVSRLVARFGVRGALLALPLVAAAVYGTLGLGLGWAALRWLKLAENATDYSVMNTGKAMIWLPTSREEKYRAKQAIDTLFVRLGDVISTALVAGAVGVAHVGPRALAAVNGMLSLAFLAVAWRVARRHEALLGAATAAGAREGTMATTTDATIDAAAETTAVAAPAVAATAPANAAAATARRSALPGPLLKAAALLLLVTSLGCAGGPRPRPTSPTAFCSDPTLDLRSLTCQR